MDYSKFIARQYGIGKTYRSSSEAFRDADYATGIWRCETENERAIQCLKSIAICLAAVAFCYILISYFF